MRALTLQFIGTEGFRHIHPEVWSRTMFGRAKRDLQRYKVVFISDVRFLSEAQIIQDNGGIVVRVKRPESNDDNQGIQGHASETELLSIKEDYVIDNQDGPLDNLRLLVKDLLCQLDFLPSTQKLPG